MGWEAVSFSKWALRLPLEEQVRILKRGDYVELPLRAKWEEMPGNVIGTARRGPGASRGLRP